MSPWLVEESKSTPKYHEIAYMKTPTREIAADDSILLSLEKGLEPRRGETLIELGCGSGLRSLHLAKKYALRLVLVDFTANAALLARDNAHKMEIACDIVRCELRHLPLRDALFDAVWAEGTHEHLIVSERWRGFAETRRIAKKGARLMIFVPNILNPIYQFEEKIKDRFHVSELYEVPFARSELDATVRNAGFQVKGGDGLEVFYTLFAYSLYSLSDVPSIVRPIYRIKRYITRTHFKGNGFGSKVLRALRRLDRKFLPKNVFGHEIAIIAEAV